MIVKSNDIIVGHFIPCIRKNDNTIGFYDIVTKVFMQSDNPKTQFSNGVF